MSGRIRTIKPELRDAPAFASLSDGAARLFLMLYTIVDDEGHCPAAPSYLAGQIFYAKPRGMAVIGRMIAELEAVGLVWIYTIKGAPYLEISGWRVRGSFTHQRIDKPQEPRFPLPISNHSTNDSESHSWTDPIRSDPTRPERESGREDSLSEASEKAESDPGAGALAQRVAQERIASGELTREDVDRSIKKFAAKKGATTTPEQYDAALAAWLIDERAPGRARKRFKSDPADAPDLTYTLGGPAYREWDANGPRVIPMADSYRRREMSPIGDKAQQAEAPKDEDGAA